MPRPDERVDEGLIHAWLDGELDAAESARVEQLVAENAEWAAAAAEARGLVAASSRILGALDVVAGDVIPRGGSAAGTAAPAIGESRVTKLQVTPRRVVPTWLRIAAGFVLVAGIGYVGRGRGEPAMTPSVASEVASDAASPARTAATPVSPLVAPPVAPQAGQDVRLRVAAKQSEAAPERREVQSPVAAMLPPQEQPAPAQVAAATPAPTVATTRGVAGGVASGVVSSALVPADHELRAKSAQRALTATRAAEAERTVESPTALSALVADRAENAATLATVSGCWRTQTTARVDSIQTSLRVLRVVGDTLVIALTPAGAEARAVRTTADLLTGNVRDVSGRSAAFRAERTGCAP